MIFKSGLPCILLLLVSLILTACHCLEEDRPETSLEPRNFNPHPYQAGYEGGGRSFKKGEPLLFPVISPGLFINGGAYSVSGSENSGRHRQLLDEHPYAALAKRRKYKEASRFQDDDENIQENLIARRALAEHGAKVLNIPPPQLKDSYVNEEYSAGKKNYAFSYKVSHQNSDDHFSHKEYQKSGATSGEYRVKLPDGRLQIVSYKADENGYNAVVKYTGDSNIESSKENYIEASNNKISPLASHPNDINYRMVILEINQDTLRRGYIGSDLSRPYIADVTPYQSFVVDRSKVDIISGSPLENIVKYSGPTTEAYTIAPQNDYLVALSTTPVPFIDNV